MEQFLVNVLSRTLLHYLSLVTHQLQSWLSFGAKTIYYRQRLKKGESRQNFSKNRRCSSAFKAALDSAKCRRIFFSYFSSASGKSRLDRWCLPEVTVFEPLPPIPG